MTDPPLTRVRDSAPVLGWRDLLELSTPAVRASAALAEVDRILQDLGVDDRDPPTYQAVVNARQAFAVAMDRIQRAGFSKVHESRR